MAYAAVLLDAYGTLVELDDPFVRLRESLRRHIGVEVAPADAERAFRAEMAFYSEECQVGADAESLAGLKAECMLTDAVAFRAFPDAASLLAGLELAGVPVAVVSNWDYSLRGTLAGLGLEFDAIVTCGETGVRKPDPGIFLEALGRLGVAPADALHIGDRDGTDGVGARAAGIDVRIVDRTGAVPGRDTIAALTDVLGLL